MAAALRSNIGFACVGLVLVYCVVHAFDPPRLNWGDSMSDYNVMNSGRNFATYGFLRLHLTPYLIDPQFLNHEDRMLLYTHYPQLPDLMNGMLRVVFHMSDLVQFRFVALGFSFASLFFIYRLLCHFWGREAAQIALGLWVINPLWLQHADYLHEAPYGAFFGFGCLYLLTRYLAQPDRPRWLVASGVFLFFTFLASYDYWFFAPLLVAMVVVGHYKTPLRRDVVRVLSILASFAVAAVLFKFATNAWALGGVRVAINDVRFQFSERATDSVTRTHYQHGIVPVAYGRIERFFSLLFFPIVAFWAVLPLARRWWRGGERSDLLRFDRANPWLLFLAALPFLDLFAELWVGQYYPTLLVLPFYAVASGALIALLMQNPRRMIAATGVALAVALAGNSLLETESFEKAFFPRATIASLAARLDSVSARGQHILINHTFDAPYRYYFHRNTNTMILVPPGVADIALRSMADPQTHPLSGTLNGAIFVEHKHLTDQMYDKSYYYILGRYGFWNMWANPERYRAPIDTLIAERDSVLMAKVAQVGKKLYDTDDYSIWRISPPESVATTPVSLRRPPAPAAPLPSRPSPGAPPE